MALEGIARRDFLVIGRVGMDVMPEPPGTALEDATAMSVAMGGSSANIAAGLVKLGCKAALVTCVSDDGVGRYCLGQLDRYGIDRTHVRAITGEERTSLALSESRLAGHQTVIYRNNAADFQMSERDIDGVDFSGYGALVAAGTVFAAEPSRTATFRAFEQARAAELPIVFDIDYRPYSWPSPEVAEEVLSRAGALSDVVIGNDEEFGFMAGDKAKGLDKARELAATTAKVVVYKKGAEGAVTLSGDSEIRTGIYSVDALKPTGAGDAFMAGFLATLGEGESLRASVLRGSAAAAITVSKPGCAPAMPDDQELDTFIAAHPGATEP